MVSERAKIKPGESVSHQFHLFLGPKSTNLLEEYGISGIIEYGWFGFVARPLSRLLHFFYRITWNYGLAIILLTVLVRGCMFPVGRKAARNAQMMQELAPEIKKIKEKYKNDMEKQAQAQRELWKKHNFNPLGGCWLMFLQLPIFIGLYRCLSVDIELRQAPLIPGVQWCSNLAAPDMFLNWETPSLQFLTGTAGWLGPYLNLLPIVTIALFMLQQKLFTPPATDEQTMMQQRMMKYMMVLMGFLFFKVPSGLCIYFIASSLWGIAERKLLPKPDLKKTAEAGSLTDRGKRKAGDEPDHRGKRKRRR
jgi:YidC/Oxa1 family membrane protein insertase